MQYRKDEAPAFYSMREFEPLTINITLESFEELRKFYKAVHDLGKIDIPRDASGWSPWWDLEKMLKEHIDKVILGG